MEDLEAQAKLNSIYFTITYVAIGLLAQWIIFSKTFEGQDWVNIIAGLFVLLTMPSFLINFIILYTGTGNTANLILISHLVYTYALWQFAFKYFLRKL